MQRRSDREKRERGCYQVKAEMWETSCVHDPRKAEKHTLE